MRWILLLVALAPAACAPQKLPPASAFEAADAAAAEVAQDVAAEVHVDAGKPPLGDAATDAADIAEATVAPDGADAQPDSGVGADAADVDVVLEVADAGDSTLAEVADAVDSSPDSGGDGVADVEVTPFVPMDVTPCADPLALPTNCTACTSGFVAVATATGSVCAPDFPLWGPRPDVPPPAWFSDSGKGTVTDSHSGRMWAKETSPVAITWEAAGGYCAGLAAGGHSDWRLPTLAELLTIRDVSAPAPTVVTALATTPKEFSWTASPVTAAAQAGYWTVLFNGGSTAFSVATAKCYARCVR